MPLRSRLRSFLAIDEREGIVNFAQTLAGKCLLFAAVFFLLLLPPVSRRLDPPLWVLLFVGAAAAHAYLPRLRAWVLFVTTWLAAFLHLPASFHGYASLLTMLVCCWCSLLYVQNHKTSVYSRRPVLTLLAALGVLTVVGVWMPDGFASEFTWSFLVLLSGYIWFLCYVITDQRSRRHSPNLVQMGLLQPFWVVSSNPVGKGAAFLRRHWSSNPRDLAITQLKGLKLLLWMDMLLALAVVLHWVFIRTLELPTQHEAVTAFVRHEPHPLTIRWASSIFDTILFSLGMAVTGHKIVGLARLAGYRLPRNMCRPLESVTLADFWNRYNFYFKEVMVDFFYIPTFLKTFRSHPRCRMFFATFMAAGVGNLIFHFIRDLPDINTLGFWKMLESYESYTLYCALLATAIGFSQLRQHAGITPPNTRLGRLRAFFVIWTFIVLLQNFDVTMRDFTLGQLLAFNASLFGLY